MEARATSSAAPPPVTSTVGPGKTTPPPDEGRKAAVAAVERPDTGDAAEDAYIYGYRLWEAKFYPEAEAQLKSVVEKYSSHRRASFAQNLRSEEHTSELQSLMRISYAVFCLKKTTTLTIHTIQNRQMTGPRTNA